MYQNYKVVCVTPAGRRRYMKVLAPYILLSAIVDRWDIWENTDDENDLRFFKHLEDSFEKVRCVKNPDGELDGCYSICRYFKTTVEKDTIYIRFDDDIVWVEGCFFEKFLEFRLSHPEYLLVFPGIINNVTTTHLLQQKKFLNCSEYVSASCMDELGWANPDFAQELHEWFLDRLKQGRLDELKFGKVSAALHRISINCFSWFGSDFAEFGGIIDRDEEEFLTVIKPREVDKMNAVFGGAFVAHFSFYVQREVLDQCRVLEQYEAVLLNNPNKEMQEIYKTACAYEDVVVQASASSGEWFGLKKYLDEIPIPALKWVKFKFVWWRLKKGEPEQKSSKYIKG